MNVPRVVAIVALFWAMQVVAQLFFKWGSDTPGRAVFGFLTGQAFGVTSIVLLMLLYRMMNANLALGICFGGSFLAAQIALAVVYRTGLATTQYAGIVAIAAGMLLLAGGK